MKKVLLSLAFVAGIFAFANAQTQLVTGPAIAVDKDTHDYGTIPFGGNGECEFKVTNTGTEPLIISQCKGSCGCTVPSWEHDPIAPGATSIIKVKYDTKRPGPINKSVTITSNATNEPTKVVRIKGTVMPDPNAPAPGSAPTAPPAGPTNN